MQGQLMTLIAPLIVLLLVLYLVYRLLSYAHGIRDEGFQTITTTRKYDIGTFLAARSVYDNFYRTEGRQLCKTAAGREEPLCSLYGGVVGPAYTYSPPRLDAAATTMTLNDQSFMPIRVEDVQLENAVFTYYRAAPEPAGANKPPSFLLADSWQIKTDVERFIDSTVGICRSESTSTEGAATSEYTCYITIGGLNYRLVKDIGAGTQELLSVAKQDPVSRRPLVLYVGCGARAPATYRRADLADAKLFETMLAADSQNKLDGDLSAVAAAAAGRQGASASAALPAGAAANLQLPPLRYVEDGWIKNAALFKQMYESLKDPVATITNYFKSSNIANTTNTFVSTLTKFVELDRRILKGRSAGGQLKTKSGAAYKFLIPNAYDPSLQLFDDNYEPPTLPAKHMKCYDLTAQESALVNYFRRGRGGVENAGVSAEELANKVQAAICASYGYYTAATAEGVCNCNGCCIPVSYKPRDGRLGVPGRSRQRAAADEASAEILSKVDNCVHISQPFKIVRPGPLITLAPTCGGGGQGLQTEEGFVELPANYGLTRGFLEARDQFAETKGSRIGGRDMQAMSVFS